MGTKHPDQIPARDWRRGGETALDMYRRRWELIAKCSACDLVTLVDLRVVVHMRGQAFSLWNRKTPCRRITFGGRCKGFMSFEFKAPGMTRHKPLEAPEPGSDGPRGHIERAWVEERARTRPSGN